MSQILTLRDAIASGLQASDVIQTESRRVSVTVHGGDFKLSDLQRYAKHAPAVVVAALRVDAENQPPALLSEVQMAAIVVTVPKAGDTRGDQALVLVDDLLRVLARGSWVDAPGSRRPRKLQAKNMFAPEIDKLGVAMWTISWTQQIDLQDTDTSVPLKTFYAAWDVYERDDGADLGEELEAEDQLEDLDV